ncbi:hypothetical protein [Sorangium sp. So ce406]|uniref:hypothetical protein n=1 Tax=Sorangium sp. So ce406 TaxID=3133311 RepID=UPI003F5BC81B
MDLRAWCAALCAGMMGLAGCGGDSGTGQDIGLPGASGGGFTGGGASGQGGDTFGGQGGGILGADVGGANGGTGSHGEGSTGCEHIDVVFAVDNSRSMHEEKESLSEIVFPAFAQALLDIEGLTDFRAAVLDACPLPANFHTRGASTEDCSFQSGEPWMDSSSSNITGEFGCAADIYSGDAQCSGEDDDEQPASAIAASLEAPFSTGDNAGFLRQDALLVVVAITDEDEQPVPSQPPQALHDRIVAAKGDARNVVFLGIGGRSACEGAYGSAEQANTLQAIADTFTADERGFFWDLCEGRLEDGLANALTAIRDACTEFVPVPN